jgi:hypothetical protein
MNPAVEDTSEIHVAELVSDSVSVPSWTRFIPNKEAFREKGISISEPIGENLSARVHVTFPHEWSTCDAAVVYDALSPRGEKAHYDIGLRRWGCAPTFTLVSKEEDKTVKSPLAFIRSLFGLSNT